MINKITEKFKKQIDTLNLIEISKSAIRNNLNVYKEQNKESAIFPVLKSNAYGHGLKQMAKILKEQNLKYVCVDSYYEYLKIRKIIDCETLIIGYTKPNNYKLFDFKTLSITVYDINTLKILGQLHEKIKIHLKIDTGMNRQGVQLYDLPAFLDKLIGFKNIILEGVFTHLADADNPHDFSYTDYQIQQFEDALEIIKHKNFNPKFIHIANSAGGLKIKNSKYNAIRLGLGLYGYNPLNTNDEFYKLGEKLQPALTFKSSVIQTKNIETGANVSYNLTFQAEEDKKIAIIPAGYYEGIDRKLSNIGFFTYNSHNLRVLGRVCMNLTIIDITNTPIQKGKKITIINNNKNSINSVANIAKLCNTIPYVITTKLAESTRRIIVD